MVGKGKVPGMCILVLNFFSYIKHILLHSKNGIGLSLNKDGSKYIVQNGTSLVSPKPYSLRKKW